MRGSERCFFKLTVQVSVNLLIMEVGFDATLCSD